MFVLRRTVAKALFAPASSYVVKSRAVPQVAPAITRLQKQWAIPSIQQRLYSLEAKDENTTSSVSDEAHPVPANEQETEQDDALVRESFSGGRSRSSRAAAENADGKTLYIGNLFFEVNEEQLHKLFSPFGALEKVQLINDNRGLSRGFAFVNFENAEDAQAAVESLHQQTFEGRRMVVQVHVPKQRNSSYAKPLVEHAPSKTLFIGNMSFEMSDKDLNDLFREIRNVLDVRVAIDRRTGQPRGFAHADFIDVESAVKAKEVLNERVVYGRSLRVDFSRPGTNFRREQ